MPPLVDGFALAAVELAEGPPVLIIPVCFLSRWDLERRVFFVATQKEMTSVGSVEASRFVSRRVWWERMIRKTSVS